MPRLGVATCALPCFPNLGPIFPAKVRFAISTTYEIKTTKHSLPQKARCLSNLASDILVSDEGETKHSTVIDCLSDRGGKETRRPAVRGHAGRAYAVAEVSRHLRCHQTLDVTHPYQAYSTSTWLP
jgi:hypothetical protein